MMSIMENQVSMSQSRDIFTSIDFSQDGKVSLEELHQDYDFVIRNAVE